MNCKKYEQWISNGLDGALSLQKKKSLEAHLAQCPECRAYHRHLGRIQAEALRLKITEPSPQYWEEFSTILERKLKTSQPAKDAPRPFRLGWKWAWAGLPVLLALALSLVFFRNRIQAPEHDVFWFEACLNRLYLEIGDDATLEDNFNRVILGSLGEGLYSEALEERVLLPHDPWLWESLSDEELQLVEQEIKREMKL
jgi:hypothetical protein